MLGKWIIVRKVSREKWNSGIGATRPILAVAAAAVCEAGGGGGGGWVSLEVMKLLELLPSLCVVVWQII